MRGNGRTGGNENENKTGHVKWKLNSFSYLFLPATRDGGLGIVLVDLGCFGMVYHILSDQERRVLVRVS